MDRILISGGTGFLGKAVVRLLRDKYYVDVLSRSSGDIKANLCHKSGGLSDQDLDNLRGRYCTFIHLAALYNFTSSEQEFYENNIVATNSALDLCKELDIPCFVNASTIATTINQTGTVGPDDLNVEGDFPDHYSKTKALAEDAVRNYSLTGVSIINIRFGVLVGPTDSGDIERIDGPYRILDLVRQFRGFLNLMPLFALIPVSKVKIPIVPVNIAAAALVKILEHFKSSSGYRSLYVAPRDGVSHEEIYGHAFESLGIRKKIVPISFVPFFVIALLGRFISALPAVELKYGFSLPTFDTAATEEVLGADWCPNYNSYKDVLWQGYQRFLDSRT